MFKSKKSKPSIAKRFLRSILSITILSAFVIGISFFIKAVSSLNIQNFVSLASPITDKLGLSQKEVGQVAGEFVQRVSETKINPTVSVNALDNTQNNTNNNENTSEKPLFTLALLADSHNDNDNLKQAIDQLNKKDIKYMLYLGDLTDWGDISSLQEAKSTLDTFKNTYFVLPGDHDLAQSVGSDNFLTVYDNPNTILTLGEYKFVLFDNSANYTPLSKSNLTWFLNQIKDADFVILSQPLYHPINPQVMGIVNGEIQEAVKKQADTMLNAIRESDVKAIIAADQHQFSINIDPEKDSLKHIVVGALTKSRNIQTPRYSIIKIYENDKYTVEDIIL